MKNGKCIYGTYGKVEQEKEVFFLKRNKFFKLDQTIWVFLRFRKKDVRMMLL